MQAAVFGNVGTLVCFRVGATDAEFLAKEFAPKFVEEDFVNLPKYNVYLKLMIDGVASDPFSATTLPPISKRTNSTETVVRVTRERYAKSRDIVEEKIVRWHGVETEAMLEKLEKELEEKKMRKISEKRVDFLASMRGENEEEEEEDREQILKSVGRQAGQVQDDNIADDDGTAEKEKADMEDKNAIVNVVNCSWCGVKTKINFNPDPRRPILCKECLKDYRRQQALGENIAKRKSGARLVPRKEDDKDKTGLSLADLKSNQPTAFRGRK